MYNQLENQMAELSRFLRDLAVFNQVRLDPEVRTLVWPNDADFDPADLHDWSEISQKFIEHAQKRETT